MCNVDYVARFFLNTVVLPVFLLSIVAITWAMDKKTEEESDGDKEFDDAKANKRSDYYFAFFLSCEY